eukprot:16450144-Heterocapsa_arctica.AAC.1
MVVVPGDRWGPQDRSPHESLGMVEGPACGLCSGFVGERTMGIWKLHGRGLSDGGLDWEFEPVHSGQ